MLLKTNLLTLSDLFIIDKKNNTLHEFIDTLNEEFFRKEIENWLMRWNILIR